MSDKTKCAAGGGAVYGPGLLGAARSGRDIAQVICSRDKKAFCTAEVADGR